MSQTDAKPIKLIFYSDPGHGWLRVPLRLLKSLDIADKISPFSYMRTEYAYLEEDRDASLFVSVMNEANRPIQYVERNTNKQSRIRNYDSYKL